MTVQRESDDAGESAPPTELRGRILRHKGNELIIEIELDEELDWIVEDEAWVHDDAGGATHARVDRPRTTSAQRVGAGQSVRLVLTLDAETPTIARVRLGGLEILV